MNKFLGDIYSNLYSKSFSSAGLGFVAAWILVFFSFCSSLQACCGCVGYCCDDEMVQKSSPQAEQIPLTRTPLTTQPITTFNPLVPRDGRTTYHKQYSPPSRSGSCFSVRPSGLDYNQRRQSGDN